MGDGFVKIFGAKLISSSLWCEAPEARLVFLGMLALAGQDGVVDVPNIKALARMLNLEVPYVERALAILEAPDEGSRTPDEDGRRVVRDGARWRLVNYQHYREFRTPGQEASRKRVAAWREKQAVTCNAGNAAKRPVCAEAEAEAEAEADRIGSQSSPRRSEPSAGTQAPLIPPEPPVFEFPCDGPVKAFPVTAALLASWQESFPSLDATAEVRAALAWIKAAPDRRKTARGVPRFVVGWLGRSQDRGGRGATGPPANGHRAFATSKTRGNEAVFRDFLAAGKDDHDPS